MTGVGEGDDLRFCFIFYLFECVLQQGFDGSGCRFSGTAGHHDESHRPYRSLIRLLRNHKLALPSPQFVSVVVCVCA